MQKDRKKFKRKFLMMNVFAGHFMGLHLAAPAKKEEKNIFFSNAKCASYLMI